MTILPREESPLDWTSLGDTAQDVLIRSIADRTFRALTADIETQTSCDMPAAEIFLCVLMHLTYVLGDTPADGANPLLWREAVAESLRRSAMEGEPLPAITGCTLTADLLIPVLAQFTVAFAHAARGVVARATQPGTNRTAILASALAAHSSQIAAGIIERAHAEKWDADLACGELFSLARVIEAMVRNNLPAPDGGASGEVQGHA